MKLYINGTSAISSLQVFTPPIDLSAPVLNSSGQRFGCLEPDYDKILEPTQIRRLSRLLKMGTATSSEAVRQTLNKNVDAIITATGYGYLEDTARFLFKMTDPADRGMNPTSFIQSTYNTISSLIALNLKNNGYNNTFVHSGFSFESALDDAIMLINAGDARNVLVGGLDELTDEVYNLLIRLRSAQKRMTKKETSVNSSTEYPFGEGSSFFVISNKPDSPDAAEICNFTLLYKPDQKQLVETFNEAVRNNNIEILFLGKNGVRVNDNSYEWISSLKPYLRSFNYKSLCGEYPTASAFSLWLATAVLSGPAESLIGIGKPKGILIYNCFEEKYHSFICLKRG